MWENNIRESHNLEYKSEITDNCEIAKDISSFANSDGGTIVYGIKERDKTNMAVFSNGLLDDGKNLEDQFNLLIHTNIAPRLITQIKIIPGEKVKHFFLVVTIPKGNFTIFQHIQSGCFYFRNNSITVKGDPSKPQEIRAFQNQIMSENEIRRRYKELFTHHKKTTSFECRKLRKFISETGAEKNLLVISLIPTLRLENSMDVKHDQNFQIKLQNHTHLNICCSKPKGDGRLYELTDLMKFEINNDKSLFFIVRSSSGFNAQTIFDLYTKMLWILRLFYSQNLYEAGLYISIREFQIDEKIKNEISLLTPPDLPNSKTLLNFNSEYIPSDEQIKEFITNNFDKFYEYAENIDNASKRDLLSSNHKKILDDILVKSWIYLAS